MKLKLFRLFHLTLTEEYSKICLMKNEIKQIVSTMAL